MRTSKEVANPSTTLALQIYDETRYFSTGMIASDVQSTHISIILEPSSRLSRHVGPSAPHPVRWTLTIFSIVRTTAKQTQKNKLAFTRTSKKVIHPTTSLAQAQFTSDGIICFSASIIASDIQSTPISLIPEPSSHLPSHMAPPRPFPRGLDAYCFSYSSDDCKAVMKE